MAKSPEKPAKQSLNLRDLKNQFKAFLNTVRPHLGFAYTLVLLTGVAAAGYLVLQTLHSSDAVSTSDSRDKSYSLDFDLTTMSKVHKLNNTDNVSVSLPDGRINPFSE